MKAIQTLDLSRSDPTTDETTRPPQTMDAHHDQQTTTQKKFRSLGQLI